MSRTHHHNKRRFHPWKTGPWPEWMRGWYHVNYSSSPSWFRHMFETKRRRRQAHMLEQRCKTAELESVVEWPLARKPTVYYW